jgi:hypothetical protein
VVGKMSKHLANFVIENQILIARSRSALVTTDTDERLIASAAIMGFDP